MQPEEPLLSVVTPFYNTEAYLAQCIESVLGQSYRRFEYILVDNCSTDRSLEIAEHYARQDSRVRVVRNTAFLTQTQNLNHGLAQISKDSVYCKLVQADDFIFPDCLAEMVAVARAHPSVGVVGAYTLLGWKDHADVYLDGLPFPSAVTPGSEICRQFLLQGRFVTGNPTCTMLRSDLVRGRRPFYNEVSPVEDVDVMFDLLHDTDFGFVHQVLTYTRRENDSIMSGWRTFGILTTMEIIGIRRYGPAYLTPGELHARRRDIERRYYRMLGESLWQRRSPKYWGFHRQALAWSGKQLEWPRVVLHAGLAALSRILNPLDTVMGVGRRLLRAAR